MTNKECIRIFDSQGEAYKQAFKTFLDHTDQKRNAKRWLQNVVNDLPTRSVFIDAGAGNGEVTKAFSGAFGRTVAIEPNAYLLNQLRAAIPDAEAIGRPIMAADPAVQGDLVLCSHTLYYIPADQWLVHLERLVSWKQTMRSDEAVVGGAAVSSDGPDGTTRSEIVGLFLLEAHEWLAQIQTALNKLRSAADRPSRSKLYGFMLNGITSLAKSASTVELTGIEAMASDLLPLLRDVGGASVQPVPETLRRLQSGLDRLRTAMHRLAEGQPEYACRTDSAEWPLSRTAVQHEVDVEDCVAVSSERVLSSLPLLSALRELQQARARSLPPARDVLEAVIQRAEQQGTGQQDHIDVGTIERILHDLDRLDEEFLQDVQDRVPAMVARLAQLRERWRIEGMVASQFDLILKDIDLLSERARSIHAATITKFLQALKAFLATTARRESAATSQRLLAVEERLNSLVPMAQQWVTLGCLERAAIEEILPA